MAVGSSNIKVTLVSDITPVLSNEFLNIQAITKRNFILKVYGTRKKHTGRELNYLKGAASIQGSALYKLKLTITMKKRNIFDTVSG